MSTVVLPSRPTTPSVNTQQLSQGSGKAEQSRSLIQLMKSLYQADHQVKLLHLQAEADTLLHQLQATLKQRHN